LSIFGAEVIGTALLILLGDGVVAAVLLNQSKAQNSGWIVITFGWAMGVMAGVFAVGQFSGAHLNPAVTLGFAVIGNTEWGDVPKYLAGEFAFEACHTAMLTFGGMGYAQEYRVERLLREVLIPRTAPVSPHMILNFLAEKVFDLPKSY